MLHDTHGHTYIHHIGITILLLFYTSFTLLGRPAGPDPSHLTCINNLLTLILTGENTSGSHCFRAIFLVNAISVKNFAKISIYIHAKFRNKHGILEIIMWFLA
jgi:hypothetical protein